MHLHLELVKVLELLPLLTLQLVLLLQPLDPTASSVSSVLQGSPSKKKYFRVCSWKWLSTCKLDTTEIKATLKVSRPPKNLQFIQSLLYSVFTPHQPTVYTVNTLQCLYTSPPTYSLYSLYFTVSLHLTNLQFIQSILYNGFTPHQPTVYTVSTLQCLYTSPTYLYFSLALDMHIWKSAFF